MKKLLEIVMAVALVGICSAAYAATVLPNEVLGELYAADIAVAAQSNTASIVANVGSITNVLSGIEQRNSAKVKRDVNDLTSAVAVQSQTNTVALGAGSNINNVEIEQKNKAEVSRRVDVRTFGASGSAVAVGPQSNTVGLVAGWTLNAGANIYTVDIEQKNKAIVKGDVKAFGHTGTATAVKSQTNTAALKAGNDINTVDIEQKNKAIVCSHADVIGHTTTAIGAQTNTAALFSAAGNISNVSISQSNRAYVGSGAAL